MKKGKANRFTRSLTSILGNRMGTKSEPDPPRKGGPEKEIGNANLTEFIPNLKKGDGYWHSQWDSPEAFYRHIKSLKRENAWDDAGWEGDAGFYGTTDMKEAITLAEDGWKEGRDRVLKLQNKILAAHPLSKRPIRYGLAGSTPNVSRAIAGDPMNMRIPDLSRTKRRPVLTILSNMSAFGYVGNAAFSNRGAVVAAIIDKIEASGFACEVISTAVSKAGWNSNFHTGVSVIVKRCDQPLDVTRLAFSLGHSSMFRRMVFADRGSEPFLKGVLHGMGSSVHVDRDESLVDKSVFVIPSVNGIEDMFATEEDAETKGLAYLILELRKQNCPAFPPLTEKELLDLEGDEDDDED